MNVNVLAALRLIYQTKPCQPKQSNNFNGLEGRETQFRMVVE